MSRGSNADLADGNGKVSLLPRDGHEADEG